MKKKTWKDGTLLMASCGLGLLALLLFESEIRIEDWPLPLMLSRMIMIVILAALIIGFVLGCRRYSAAKKAGDAQKKSEHGRQVLSGAKENAVKTAKEEAVSGEKTGLGAEKNKAEIPQDSGAPSGEEKDQFDLPKDRLKDASYIAKSHRTAAGAWQQYDFLLAARIYGWDYMVSQADYLAQADLENIGTVTVAAMANTGEAELVSEYHAHGDRIREMPALKQERGVLAIGGMSRALHLCPVKIVWFNQTKVLRVFTIVDDDELLLRYVETAIRRTFGTPDAMKLAEPTAPLETPAS